MPESILALSAPEWDLLGTQHSLKYATFEQALQLSTPSVRVLIQRMHSAMAPRVIREEGYAWRVDVRFWPKLVPGQLPGLSNWHYDCYNQKDDPRSQHEIHALYISGAGSRTEFEGTFIRENEVWVYVHNERHRIRPATLEGPRLLVRVSWCTIPARIYRGAA